jgi:hypothetical protein
LVTFQRLDVRFPLRAADGSMSMDRLLTAPARSEANCGSRTRLPLHPTGNSAGRFAPCLACNFSRGWPGRPALAGLGIAFLLRGADELALSVASLWSSRTSRWSRKAPRWALSSRRDRRVGLCVVLNGTFEALGMHCELNARPNVRAKLPAEACSVSLVCEGAEGAAHQAYAACRSGSA